MRYVFMCRSLTYAQSAARVLEKKRDIGIRQKGSDRA